MIKYGYTLILLTLSIITSAQEVFDLPTLIRRALMENYNILIVRNEEQIAANNNTLGNAGFLPTLDLTASNSRSNNNTRMEYFTGVVRESDEAKSRNLRGDLAINWKIFDGFMMFARKEQLGLLQELGSLDSRYYIEQTVADIAVAWYQLIKENMLLSNYHHTLDVSRFRLSLEKKKLDVGSGNLLLYNQALVDFSSDSIMVMSQQRLIRSLIIQINKLVNLDPELKLEIHDPEINPEMIEPKDSLISRAVEVNREIKMVMLQEMIAETNIRIKQANYYPEINLYGQGVYNKQTNEVGTIQYGKTYGLQAGITVRFNLFNGFNDKREIENARLARENSLLGKENMIMQIKSNALDNYYQYQSVAEQLILAEQNTQTAQRSLDIAKVQYEQGTISSYDFRQTQLSLIRAQNTATSLKYILKSIEIELDRLSGKIFERYF